MRNFIQLLWATVETWWSNFYWKHIQHAVTDIRLRLCDYKRKDDTISQYLLKIARRLMDSFEYTHDGLEQLGDSTPPPPEAYYQFTLGALKDDCDGYHAALYHIAHETGIECRLLTILSTKNTFGHCVLVFKEDDEWKVLDYLTIFSIQAAKEYYKSKCEGAYTNYARVYNYDKCKYKLTKERYFQ